MENVFNETNFHFLLDGLYLTLMVAVATCMISIILGTFLAIRRENLTHTSGYLHRDF